MTLLFEQSVVKFHWTFTIMIFLLKIIGLAPFSYYIPKPGKNRSHDASAGSFRFSKIGLAYNILFVIFLQIFYAIGTDSKSARKPLSTPMIVNAKIFCHLTTTLIILFTTVRQKNAVSIFNKLINIDRFFSVPEDGLQPRRSISVSFVMHIIFNVFLWVVLRTLEALRFQLGSVQYLDWFGWLSYALSNIGTYLFVMEYFILVKIISMELDRVNKILLKLKELPQHSYRKAFFTDDTTVASFSRKAQIHRLKSVLKIRTKLHDVSTELANFFSFPILIVTASNLSIFLSDIVLFIVEIRELSSPDPPSMSTFVRYITSTVAIIYSMTCLSASVDEATNQAKLTGWIIHKLLAATSELELKVELRQFSVQLLHERATFTAYGLFELNCDTLHSVLAVSITYIIILSLT